MPDHDASIHEAAPGDTRLARQRGAGDNRQALDDHALLAEFAGVTPSPPPSHPA